MATAIEERQMSEAQEFAYLKVEDIIKEFKRLYPGPYLDRSSKGLTLLALQRCLEELS
jgi:hypothetical protein